MRGEYKVPGGKLVAVDLEVRDGRLAEVSVSGPGVFAQEYGAVITPGRGTPIRSRKTGQVLRYVSFLTFRLYQPSDTSKPTGRWVRARRVTIKAKHPLGDSAREALASLWLDLGDDA